MSKTRRFTKAALAGLAACGTLAGCVHEGLEPEEEASEVMCFRLVGRTPTKGTPTTSAYSLSQIADLQVWAYFASAPTLGEDAFCGVKQGGVLTLPAYPSGFDVWQQALPGWTLTESPDL